MALINENYLKLQQNYLFADIGRRVKEYKAANPNKKVVSLGIGDVTRPLPQACVDAMHAAVQEFTSAETFKGYSPAAGYDFLLNAIADGDYKLRGVDISPDEIIISDGAKSDCGNIGDIFATGNIVALSDPVYPVYYDTNVMAGRKIKFLPCVEQNGFAPLPPDFHADIIYLCSPNNPTGAALNTAALKAWVDYALENEAVIIYDSAYERYIGEEGVPHSIYEVEGAERCAIEIRSFSKTAGFTGVRCGYTVVPKQLEGRTAGGKKVFLHPLWLRRQSTKFNGTSYIVQRGAEAVYTPSGREQVSRMVGYYMKNAEIIREGLKKAGFSCSGGVNAPYIWLKCPNGMKSWDLFDMLLNRVQVVGTPGVGFGEYGEGYFRLTSFGSREDTIEAVERIKGAF